MATFLEFMPGAAAVDATSPPDTDNGGLIFPADGVDHSCGWTKFVPASLRGTSSLTLRFTFIDGGIGAGVVQYNFDWFNAADTGPILAMGSYTLLVTVPNVAMTSYSVDIAIASWVASNTTLFLLTMKRDSSNPADTFAHSHQLFGARAF